MGFLDALLGRTKPKKADLDALFALSGAAVTLETAAGLHSAGAAAVCFKASTGQAFAQIKSELDDLLALSVEQTGSTLDQTQDSYGYHWVVLRDPDIEDLVTTAHLVNATLSENGFGHQLLASVFAFTGGAGPTYLVYGYKRGAFYPFVPASGEKRDNQSELRLRGMLDGEIPIEADLSRWYPIWGVPIP